MLASIRAISITSDPNPSTIASLQACSTLRHLFAPAFLKQPNLSAHKPFRFRRMHILGENSPASHDRRARAPHPTLYFRLSSSDEQATGRNASDRGKAHAMQL